MECCGCECNGKIMIRCGAKYKGIFSSRAFFSCPANSGDQVKNYSNGMFGIKEYGME
jgi:hypothetical protein